MMKFSIDQEAQSYGNFVLTRSIPLEELYSTFSEWVHLPSGARVFHIANNDPENLFCLSFQTLPDSSNGVAHILEHIVLCGSKKYPVKDPFFSMARRSLNTFMNAFTGQDFTCYPASSQVEKDFYNLLSVYLDATFHPELRRTSFLQEGHRLSFKDRDITQSLHFEGIVYNEMKGSLASADSRLWKSLFHYLLPDLPYSHCSGGDPQEIPNLTYEELISFHQNFYHPSRCVFFFYGNLPIAKHLDFLEENALKNAEKLAPLAPIQEQKRFSSPQIIEESYPISSLESLEKKEIVAIGFLTTKITHQKELLALSLLDSLLMEHDGSLLKKALLKSGLTTQVSSLLDTQITEAPWVFICKGCPLGAREKISLLIEETLKTLLNKPFSQEEIDATFHQFEFEQREINNDEGPFGLSLFFRSILLAHHGVDPIESLKLDTLLKELKEEVKDPSFFSSLIHRYLIQNPHKIELSLKPDPSLEEKENAQEKAKLLHIEQKLSKEEKRKIVEEEKKLQKEQEKIEGQSLDCLPKLKISEIPHDVHDFPLKKVALKNLDLFHHNCFTNKILYADLLFDLPAVSKEELYLLSLSARLLPELGAKGRSYEENLAKMQAKTGGISASLSLHISFDDPNLCKPSFGLKGKALEANSRELFQMFADLCNHADWNDRERIKDLLSQHMTALEHRLVKNGLNYATQKALSSFSVPSFIFEHWHGLSYYQKVLSYLPKIDELIDQLQQFQKKLFQIKTYDLVLACDDLCFEKLTKEKDFQFLEDLLIVKEPSSFWDHRSYFPEKIKDQARNISSPVASVALGMKAISYKEPNSACLALAAELLQNCWLHQEIREKGGAYGAGADFSATTGNFYLYSYRDPHPSKSIKAFDKSLQKLAEGLFDEEDLEEAKLSTLQSIDAPVIPSNRAMLAYAWQRSGKEKIARIRFREKILKATKEEVAQMAKKELLSQEKNLVTFLSDALHQKEKLPFPLLGPMDDDQKK